MSQINLIHTSILFPWTHFILPATTNIMSARYMSHPSYLPSSDHPNNLMESENCASHQFAIFSSPLSLHPSYIEIFFHTPCSRKPSIRVPYLMWDTYFHAHTQNNAQNYTFVYFSVFETSHATENFRHTNSCGNTPGPTQLLKSFCFTYQLVVTFMLNKLNSSAQTRSLCAPLNSNCSWALLIYYFN